MICPKCGFHQPDDIYCALCGVNIEKYIRKKRKQQYKIGVFLALIAVGSFFAAKYIKSIYYRQAPELTGTYDMKGHEATAEKDFDLQGGKDRNHRRPLPEGPLAPKTEGGGPSPRDEPDGTATLGQRTAESSPEQNGETYTAIEWFKKGLALDNESEAEMECYQKALELDQEFAGLMEEKYKLLKEKQKLETLAGRDVNAAAEYDKKVEDLNRKIADFQKRQDAFLKEAQAVEKALMQSDAAGS